jgi:hypothetical protein
MEKALDKLNTYIHTNEAMEADPGIRNGKMHQAGKVLTGRYRKKENWKNKNTLARPKSIGTNEKKRAIWDRRIPSFVFRILSRSTVTQRIGKILSPFSVIWFITIPVCRRPKKWPFSSNA